MIQKSGKRAFTLVELLVVVAMIAAITGAFSTSVAAAMQRARVQKATSEVKLITQAILAYENYSHELTPLSNAQADRNNLDFLLGNGKSNSGTEVPILIQAALSSSGVIRDPWGMPYHVTIRKGKVGTVKFNALKTGYYLPNFYRLTEGERK